MTYDVLVIGCGAAGMMAAVSAAQNGVSVLVLERNEKPGKKLYITGKGRCNLTNAGEDYFGHIVRNPRFLYSAQSAMDQQAVMRFFEEQGVPLKVERGERVFPQSDKASDITRALVRRMDELGISVRMNCRVVRLEHTGSWWQAVLEGGNTVAAHTVIVATGGLAYPGTGSTGDGYAFARQHGLSVYETRPALVPVETVEAWPCDLTGIALKNVTLSLQVGKKVKYKEMGEMLFTHFGVSGPLVLEASSYMDDKAPCDCLLTIDLKPALDADTLDKRLQRELAAHSNQNAEKAVETLVPKRMAPVLMQLAELPNIPCHSVTREQRAKLGAVLKGIRLHVKGLRGYNEAIVTRGGVSCKEINPSSMEAKRVPGLYFAGEVLDVDGTTGGFNLQIAFSTGALAGKSAAACADEKRLVLS